MKTDTKALASKLFRENLHIISEKGQTAFRRMILDTLVFECNISMASAATQYNNAKKAAQAEHLPEVVELGRIAPTNVDGSKSTPFEDEDCITVCEVVNNVVTRTQSFLDEDLARREFQVRLNARIPSCWKLLKGLGPNVGETYRLQEHETELA